MKERKILLTNYFRYGVTLKEAFSFVQSKRFCCNPNEGFMAQLREYEPIYRALHTVPLPLPGDNMNRASMKRGLEPEDEGESAITSSSSGSVMDTSAIPQQFGVASSVPQPTSFSSSSESSVSSSSESLPHVISTIQHHHVSSPPQLQSPQPADTPMSLS